MAYGQEQIQTGAMAAPGPSELPPRPERVPTPSRVPDVIRLSCQAVRLIGRNPGRGGVAMQSRHYRSMISRKHASIRFSSELAEWVVQDLESLNGVHVNGVRIAAKQDSVLQNGDRVVFGLCTDLNELVYVFDKTDNRTAKLYRSDATPKRKLTACTKVRGHACIMTVGGRPCTRMGGRAPCCRPPSPSTSLPQTPPTGAVPSPTIGEGTVSDSNAPLDVELILYGGSNATLDSFESQSPILVPESPILVPDTPTSDIVICSSPPRKKPRSNDTLDSLFDAPADGTSAKMEDEIFGRTPTLTPRARAVLKGIGVTATEIQVELARDEVEKEKKMVESKYKVLKNELANKERTFIETQEKAKLCETIEQELICVICQELLIRAHTLSCSHSFCEYCVTKWDQSNKTLECPVCRTVIRQKPVRSLAIDNIIRSHVTNLPREQQVSRRAVELEHYRSLGLHTSSLPPIKRLENSSSLGSANTPIVISNSP